MRVFKIPADTPRCYARSGHLATNAALLRCFCPEGPKANGTSAPIYVTAAFLHRGRIGSVQKLSLPPFRLVFERTPAADVAFGVGWFFSLSTRREENLWGKRPILTFLVSLPPIACSRGPVVRKTGDPLPSWVRFQIKTSDRSSRMCARTRAPFWGTLSTEEIDKRDRSSLLTTRRRRGYAGAGAHVPAWDLQVLVRFRCARGVV